MRSHKGGRHDRHGRARRGWRAHSAQVKGRCAECSRRTCQDVSGSSDKKFMCVRQRAHLTMVDEEKYVRQHTAANRASPRPIPTLAKALGRASMPVTR